MREAVLAAARARRRERLREESRRLADDPRDLAEARAIQSDLEPFRAW
ncbi:MAG: hypothetical protein H0V33_06515 [Acidimicrobiia bacterium]|nr:hypothetical protein [Acidimicrobiia bacterium]